MPTIRPISDLRNHTQEVARICHDTGEPVFITRNGEGDLVLLSQAAWERLNARLELYALLEEAELDVANGDRGEPLETVRQRLGL